MFLFISFADANCAAGVVDFLLTHLFLLLLLLILFVVVDAAADTTTVVVPAAMLLYSWCYYECGPTAGVLCSW